MDMLDRFLGHDTAASRALLVLSLRLPDEQLDRPLGVDLDTLRGTIEHVARRVQAEGRLGARAPQLAVPIGQPFAARRSTEARAG
jgi:hypothetical protein